MVHFVDQVFGHDMNPYIINKIINLPVEVSAFRRKSENHRAMYRNILVWNDPITRNKILSVGTPFFFLLREGGHVYNV